MRTNILLITADDLNYNSTGIFGCGLKDITPNIDKLAVEGMRFEHSHVTISVCQPSRQVLMTGRYPHRNGAMGFEPIAEDVATLQEQLKSAGYLNGIIGKTLHLAPEHKYCWDYCIETLNKNDMWGRDPQKHYIYTKAFLEKSKNDNKPFFLMVNSNDPHRPFAGSEDEIKKFGQKTRTSRRFSPDEIEVPGFLPDIPDVRLEISQYFTSVHRCDESVGMILKALDESGLADNTMVIFLSDNGMAVPFAKANCYLNSTKTPWFIRWPGKIKPNSVDANHMISGIDFMPTVLEALELPVIDGMDGKSFLPILTGGKQQDRDNVYTMFNLTSAKGVYPMRCMRGKKYGYIFNFWSDGKTLYLSESKHGLTYEAMKSAAAENAYIAERVNLLDYRTKEEFYDFEKDPDGLSNLMSMAEHKSEIDKLKKLMLKEMQRSNDPVAEEFMKYL